MSRGPPRPLPAMPGKVRVKDVFTRSVSSFQAPHKAEYHPSEGMSTIYSSKLEWERAIRDTVDINLRLQACNRIPDGPDYTDSEDSTPAMSDPSSSSRVSRASSATSLYSDAEDDAKGHRESCYVDCEEPDSVDSSAGHSPDLVVAQPQFQQPIPKLAVDCSDESTGSSTEASIHSGKSSVMTTIELSSPKHQESVVESSLPVASSSTKHIKPDGKAPLVSIRDIAWDLVAEEDVSSLCAAYDAPRLTIKRHSKMGTRHSKVASHKLKSNYGLEHLPISTSISGKSTNLTSPKAFERTPSGFVIDTSKLATAARNNVEHQSQTETMQAELAPRRAEFDKQYQERLQHIDFMLSRLQENELLLEQGLQAIKHAEAVRARHKEEERAAEQRRIERENVERAIALQRKLDEEAAEARRIAEERARIKECQVCGDEKDRKHFHATAPTPRCKHVSQICKDCLDSWISSALDDHGIDGIKCPECPEKLVYEDVKIGASTKTFETYDKITTRNALSQLPEFAWCMAPGCKSGQLNTNNNNFMDCSECGYKQCTKHQVKWHSGETCEKYEYRTSGAQAKDEEAKTLAMLDSMSKICPGPGCGWRIQKNEGCDHVTCRKCKFEFCWQCLASHIEIKKVGNTAHKKDCKFHSTNLDLAWPFNRH